MMWYFGVSPLFQLCFSTRIFIKQLHQTLIFLKTVVVFFMLARFPRRVRGHEKGLVSIFLTLEMSPSMINIQTSHFYKYLMGSGGVDESHKHMCVQTVWPIYLGIVP